MPTSDPNLVEAPGQPGIPDDETLANMDRWGLDQLAANYGEDTSEEETNEDVIEILQGLRA